LKNIGTLQAMESAPRVRVFLAMSLDGYIAGLDNDLSWLHREGAQDTFTPFMAGVGCMLMGRKTHDVVAAMGGPAWAAYGDTPVLVATNSPLLQPAAPTVRAVGGPIEELIAHAKAEAAAGGKDKCVYLDGGALVRSAMDAGLVDTLTLTVIPVVLTAGVSLFTGIASRVDLTLTSSKEIGGGMVQLQYDVMQQ
jgi:dihydrofolate reductase